LRQFDDFSVVAVWQSLACEVCSFDFSTTYGTQLTVVIIAKLINLLFGCTRVARRLAEGNAGRR
jgi:hypothetical protein